MRAFAKVNGIYKLAERYPAPHEPEGGDWTGQTVKIGAVRYRRCVTVGTDPEGLFLGVCPPLGRARKLLIPWDEIREVREARLYGRQGIHLSIGEPEVGEITMYRELFERMREHWPK
jgi:hypothetical protein